MNRPQLVDRRKTGFQEKATPSSQLAINQPIGTGEKSIDTRYLIGWIGITLVACSFVFFHCLREPCV